MFHQTRLCSYHRRVLVWAEKGNVEKVNKKVANQQRVTALVVFLMNFTHQLLVSFIRWDWSFLWGNTESYQE